MNAKEKKKEQKPRSEDSDAGAADLIRELGLAAPGTDFESDRFVPGKPASCRVFVHFSGHHEKASGRQKTRGGRKDYRR